MGSNLVNYQHFLSLKSNHKQFIKLRESQKARRAKVTLQRKYLDIYNILKYLYNINSA